MLSNENRLSFLRYSLMVLLIALLFLFEYVVEGFYKNIILVLMALSGFALLIVRYLQNRRFGELIRKGKVAEKEDMVKEKEYFWSSKTESE
jgi:hypothetical protein